MENNYISSFILAYLIIGLSFVNSDLSKDPMDAPSWTLHPTLKMKIFICLTWFFRPIIEGITGSPLRRNNTIAIGLFTNTWTFLISFTAIIVCHNLTQYITNKPLFYAPLFAIFIFIMYLLIIPILTIPLNFIMLLLLIPLQYLFPVKKKR